MDSDSPCVCVVSVVTGTHGARRGPHKIRVSYGVGSQGVRIQEMKRPHLQLDRRSLAAWVEVPYFASGLKVLELIAGRDLTQHAWGFIYENPIEQRVLIEDSFVSKLGTISMRDEEWSSLLPYMRLPHDPTISRLSCHVASSWLGLTTGDYPSSVETALYEGNIEFTAKVRPARCGDIEGE